MRQGHASNIQCLSQVSVITLVITLHYLGCIVLETKDQGSRRVKKNLQQHKPELHRTRDAKGVGARASALPRSCQEGPLTPSFKAFLEELSYNKSAESEPTHRRACTIHMCVLWYCAPSIRNFLHPTSSSHPSRVVLLNRVQ